MVIGSGSLESCKIAFKIMQKPKKLTLKKLAISFGERIGEDVYPRQIKVSGNWLFHKSDYLHETEIACYWAKNCQYNSGVLSAEPWDFIKKEDSPFTYHNQDKVFEVCQRLDKEYTEYLKEV